MRCPSTALVFCVFLLLLLAASPASAAILIVDQSGGGDFTEIQPAIHAASPGDLILVHAGTYEEIVDFLGKDVEVRATEGAAVTTIRPPGGIGSATVFDDGESTMAVLDGFTLRDGTGTEHRGTARGGGAFCVTSSPTIRNCRFINNHTPYAGALYAYETDATIQSCEFVGNSSTGWGGAIGGLGRLTVQDCLFEDNSAGLDGTVYVHDVCTIERCIFRGNRAREGSGIECATAPANVVIRDCLFEDNVALVWHGAGVRVHEASPTIDGCVFSGNWATEDGGAILALDGGITTVTNCTFWGNGAGRNGGTMAAWYGSTILASNCIFAATRDQPATFCMADGWIQFECNDFWGNPHGNASGNCPDPVGAAGNFAADPLFCDPDGGDFGLFDGSPCAPGGTACGLVGALGVACGPTAIESATWGQVRAMYRDVTRQE